MARRSLALDVRHLALHEAGYRCANPTCRTIVTLDIHHLQRLADDGKDTLENLLVLCPNCHALHHRGEIPHESLRAWKMLLLSLNEAFDRRSVDLLLALHATGRLYVSGEGVLTCASLIAGGLVQQGFVIRYQGQSQHSTDLYSVELTERGRAFVDAWKRGDQQVAISGAA